MLSLCELRRIASILDSHFAGYRLERCVETSGERLALALYGHGPENGEGEKRLLLLCCARELSRVSEIDMLPRAPSNPPAFVSYLRSHLSRARLLSAKVLGDDRQLALRFAAREGEFDLILSLLGNRSNLYVVDADGCVRAALRPAADTRCELVVGASWTNPRGRPPSEGEDRWSDLPDSRYLAAVESEYAVADRARDTHEMARRLRQVLKRETKSAQRRLERVERELAEADQANELQRRGELLKGALGRIGAGDDQVRAHDYESGEEVVIPLDPSKTPQQNLEATFKRYQKLLRRLAKAGGQLDQARERCESIAGLEAELEALESGRGEPDPDALAALARHPTLAGLLAKRRTPTHPASGGEPTRLPARLRELPQRLHPRRYRSLDGLEIWVGRSDQGNDYLTTRLARGNDLFFHLDGAPGSHVILLTEGRSDPPSESILDACELAIHFSKQKNVGRADVHVVPIKRVRKPKGAKPGLVWVTGGKTVHLRRSDQRLTRLLQSRED